MWTAVAVAVAALCGLAHGGAYSGCTGYRAVHHFKLGFFDAAVLSDGDLVMRDNPFETPLVAVHRSYRNLSMSVAPYRFAQNILMLWRGNTVILVDTGLGSYKGHGEDAGKLLSNMALFGKTPEMVTHVLITHGRT